MVLNRGPSAYQPNALPLGQTGSHGTPAPDHASSTPIAFVTSLGMMMHDHDTPAHDHTSSCQDWLQRLSVLIFA